MASGDGLILDGRVPVGADEVDLTELLEVESLAAGPDLKYKSIDRSIGEKLVTINAPGAAVKAGHLHSTIRQPFRDSVDFLVIVAEDQLGSAIIFSLQDSFDDLVSLALILQGISQEGLIIKDAQGNHTLHSLLEHPHVDAGLSGTLQHREVVEAAGPERVLFSHGSPAELKMSVNVFCELSFSIILPLNLDHVTMKWWKLDTNTFFGSFQDQLARDSQDVIFVDIEGLFHSEHSTETVEVGHTVLDWSACHKPLPAALQSQCRLMVPGITVA